MSSALEIAAKELANIIDLANTKQIALDELAGVGRTTETVKGNAADLIAHKAETTTKLFNVMTGYGATGDGVTNDNASVQAAIDAASLAGGGTVFFPYMSTNYMISGLTAPANVRLWGFGSKLKLIDASNADMIRITGDNVLIEGLELDGNKLNQTTATVRGIVSNSLLDGITVKNCIIRDTKYDGIYFGDSADNCKALYNSCYGCGRFGIGLAVSVKDILVQGNYVETSGFSAICLVGSGTSVSIIGNKTYNTGEDGFAGYNAANVDLHVIGNTFRLPGNNGMHVGGTRGIVISDNLIFQPTQYGIFVNNNDASLAYDVTCTGNLVEDAQNIHGIYFLSVNGGVIGNNLVSGSVAGQGISLNVCQNISVSGNTARSCAGTGIRVVNSFENTIIGNNVDTCADGIRLNDTGTACINNTIVGNKVMNGTGGGIVSQNLADYNIVTNNIVLSNGGGISLVGSNNIFESNIMPLGDYKGTATIDPVSLADGAGVTVTIAVVGAALGDYCEFSAPYSLQGITATAYVSVAGTVSIRLQNETGGTIDLASGIWKARISKGA
jgi:parallel beta-helix repeat protein